MVIQNQPTPAYWKEFLLTITKRFSAVYFFLFSLPFPVQHIPFLTDIGKWYFAAVKKVVVWTGTHLIGVPAALLVNSDGSSDTTFNYITLVLLAVVSAMIVIAWSTNKPLRKFFNPTLPAAITYVRYYLAFTLLRYGFEKIVKAQFPFPYFNLNETYGESSPLRLFKSFMGFSPAYNVFLGLSEAAAAVLLLFQRSKLFGALLSTIILTNIVVLNFTFDLSVKMVSLILLLMSLFTLLTGQKLLLTIYIRMLSSVANRMNPTVVRSRRQKVWTGIKIVTVVFICYSTGAYVWKVYTTSGDGAFESYPLFGIYNIESFTKNGDTLLALTTDTTRWKALSIGSKQHASLIMMNDSLRDCRLLIDTTGKNIRIQDREDTAYKSQLSYSFRNAAQLVLRGRIKTDSVYIVLHKQDYSQYRLVNRGFHWISEYSYSR